MLTRSEKALNYFIFYLVLMCITGFYLNILGNVEIALKLNVFAIALFGSAVVYKFFMLIRSNGAGILKS